MKKILPLLLIATLVTANSCNKNVESAMPVTQDGTASIRLNICSGQSKTTVRSDADDKAIKSVTVMVFNSDGHLENICEGEVDNSGTLNKTIKTSFGTKTVWAIANPSSTLKTKLSAITDLSSLLSTRSTLDEDNANASFLMSGSATNVNVNSSSVPLTINVKRMVSRLEIHSITNGISEQTDNLIAGKTFTINAIYLINVAADVDFGTGAPSVWYNKTKNTGDAASLLADTGINKILKQGDSYTTDHYFYCYPNPCTTAGIQDEEWSPRRTRLVIDVLIGDGAEQFSTYYSLELPDTGKNDSVTTLSSNRTYSISSCTITRQGSDDPWIDVPVGCITLTVSVTDWETGATYEYTI